MPQNLLKMTKSKMKSYVDSVSLLYVRDNREVLSLFFFVSEYVYIRYENDHAKIFELFSVKKTIASRVLFIHPLIGFKGQRLDEQSAFFLS